jgi:glycosyltransferase involved in cell wall biosynthesis
MTGICILPKLSGLGGPVSFQSRLVEGLRHRGFAVHHNPLQIDTVSILIIGGTRQIASLWKARRKGVRIVQRLNGMNWLHRKQPTGWRHFVRSEMNNLLLAYIRRNLADRVVYQSNFACNWWRTVRGEDRVKTRVIFNGVDLKVFTPEGEHERPADHLRVLMVEGHLRGGYEQGLETALRLVQGLNRLGTVSQLVVAGDVPDDLRHKVNNYPDICVNWAGIVPQERIPFVDRSAHILFSSDLNAACPNSVIEAMACGLPVVGYATGSLPELILGNSGRVAPYGSNYWNLEKPDIDVLAQAAMQVVRGGEIYRREARKHAEENFGLDLMVEAYRDMLLG